MSSWLGMMDDDSDLSVCNVVCNPALVAAVLNHCQQCNRCMTRLECSKDTRIHLSRLCLCRFSLQVALNTTGAAHYVVVVNNSPTLNTAPDATALTNQNATLLFAGQVVAASGDIAVPQANTNITQVINVSPCARRVYMTTLPGVFWSTPAGLLGSLPVS